jgi:hypothetical protein
MQVDVAEKDFFSEAFSDIFERKKIHSYRDGIRVCFKKFKFAKVARSKAVRGLNCRQSVFFGGNNGDLPPV